MQVPLNGASSPGWLPGELAPLLVSADYPPVYGTTSMADTCAGPRTPVKASCSMLFVTVTVLTWAQAVSAPASAATSKLVSSGAPLAVTSKTLHPAWEQPGLFAAKYSRSVYVPSAIGRL